MPSLAQSAVGRHVDFLIALNALNFFMADVRDGLGPFLGVFLQEQNHWSPAEIGLVMTIGGLAGMVATAPLGALVDRTRAKRSIMVVTAIAIVAASACDPVRPDILHGDRGRAGRQRHRGRRDRAGHRRHHARPWSKQKGLCQRVGRNEAFNHGGNVVAAVFAGALGYVFGLGAVFAVLAAMAVASIGAVAFIDPAKIDYRRRTRRVRGAGQSLPRASRFLLPRSHCSSWH